MSEWLRMNSGRVFLGVFGLALTVAGFMTDRDALAAAAVAAGTGTFALSVLIGRWIHGEFSLGPGGLKGTIREAVRVATEEAQAAGLPPELYQEVIEKTVDALIRPETVRAKASIPGPDVGLREVARRAAASATIIRAGADPESPDAGRVLSESRDGKVHVEEVVPAGADVVAALHALARQWTRLDELAYLRAWKGLTEVARWAPGDPIPET